MSLRSCLSAVAGVAAIVFANAPAAADGAPPETQLAIVVGNNASASLGRGELRYADDDAVKYATLLGGDVELLARLDDDTARLFPEAAKVAKVPTRSALDAAVDRIVERAKSAQAAGKK